MLRAHPYRAVLSVLVLTLVCGLVSGMIGQYNDGPWGGLPEWLGALTWFGFLASVLALILLAVYLAVVHVRARKGHDGHRAHPA